MTNYYYCFTSFKQKSTAFIIVLPVLSKNNPQRFNVILLIIIIIIVNSLTVVLPLMFMLRKYVVLFLYTPITH